MRSNHHARFYSPWNEYSMAFVSVRYFSFVFGGRGRRERYQGHEPLVRGSCKGNPKSFDFQDLNLLQKLCNYSEKARKLKDNTLPIAAKTLCTWVKRIAKEWEWISISYVWITAKWPSRNVFERSEQHSVNAVNRCITCFSIMMRNLSALAPNVNVANVAFLGHI